MKLFIVRHPLPKREEISRSPALAFNPACNRTLFAHGLSIHRYIEGAGCYGEAITGMSTSAKYE